MPERGSKAAFSAAFPMHEILLVPSQRQCWNSLEAYKSQRDAKKSLAYGSLTAQLNLLPSITGAGKCQKEGTFRGPGARRVQKHTFPKRLLCCGSSQGQADSHQCGSPECQDGEANWHFSCFIIRGVDKKSKKTLEEECEIAGFGVGLCGKRQLRQNRADKQMGCESSEG